jgi:hypothetical protein
MPMTRTLILSLLVTAALAPPVAAQATGGNSPNSNPGVSGSVDAPKTSTSATTPKQQLPGEAQTTTSTEPSEAGPTTVVPPTSETVTPAPQTKPRKHHPKAKTAIQGPADEPGAPPPH